jgi:hypothetical protein
VPTADDEKLEKIEVEEQTKISPPLHFLVASKVLIACEVERNASKQGSVADRK